MFSFLHKPRELSELDRRANDSTLFCTGLAILAVVILGMVLLP